ncbi:MAG: HAD family hydrolase, partial [Puniceicoccales bacterium]
KGMRIAILSGDAQERVDSMAQQLGLDPTQAKARCTPEEKAAWMESNAPHSALMIGDGANDCLAFEKAICRGTPVVDRSLLESSSDFFFFGRSLRSLPLLFQVASARKKTVQAVFALAVAYNLGAVALCLSGAMHPLLAAILMPLSSIATLAVTWSGLGRVK